MYQTSTNACWRQQGLRVLSCDGHATRVPVLEGTNEAEGDTSLRHRSVCHETDLKSLNTVLYCLDNLVVDAVRNFEYSWENSESIQRNLSPNHPRTSRHR